MTLRNVVAVGLVFVGLQSGAASAAQVNANMSSDLALKHASVATDGELVLVFQEIEEVANACDLLLRRFEYLPALKTLVLDFNPVQFCPIDRIGKRQGVFKWQLGSELRNTSGLLLIVNGKKLGELAIN